MLLAIDMESMLSPTILLREVSCLGRSRLRTSRRMDALAILHDQVSPYFLSPYCYDILTLYPGEIYRKRYFKDATFDALRVIEPVAEKHNLSLLEIALRWCVHHSALKMTDGGRDGVIIGISSFAQLESNLKDLEKGPLPEEVVQTLDQAWLIAKPTTPNYWHLDLKYTYDTKKEL